LPVPDDLRQRILARVASRTDEQRQTRHSSLVTHTLNIWWRQPSFIAAAVAITVLAALIVFWPSPKSAESFSSFRARMVQTALRNYRMDLVTADLSAIRQYLSTNQYYADYVLPEPLEKLPGDGCAKLKWHDKKVSMVCFDTGA